MRENVLLQGSIRPALIRLALPLLAGNILQQLYNAVDALIVGKFLGTAAFASTGVSGTVLNLFLFALSGFCVGISVLFAQFYGAGQPEDFRRGVFTALVFGGLIAFALSGVSLILLRTLLSGIGTPADLIPHCMDYLRITLAGLICAYLYNLFSGILRAMGDTKASLLFLLLSVLINAALDYVLIRFMHAGIRGAAFATVLAQLLAAAACALYLRRNYPTLLCTRKDIGIYPALLRRLLRLGLVSALHQSSLYIGKLLVQGAVNRLGTEGIAAYTAALRIEGFTNSFGDSGSQAMSIFISQNHGAKNHARVKQGFRQGMVLLILLGATLSVIMELTARFSVALFLDAGESMALAAGCRYLRIVAAFYTFCYIGYAYVGYFRGIGRVGVPFVGTTLHLSIRVILTHLIILRLGLPAVAIATGTGWILLICYQCAIYYSDSIRKWALTPRFTGVFHHQPR